MSDKELVGYFEIHCRTDRALFHSKDINRLLELAGRSSRVPEGFFACHVESWQPVIDDARAALAKVLGQ